MGGNAYAFLSGWVKAKESLVDKFANKLLGKIGRRLSKQQNGHYDENGNWIETDEHGNPVKGKGKGGKGVGKGHYDADGNWICDDGGMYDKDGNYVPPGCKRGKGPPPDGDMDGYYDEHGNFIPFS